MSLSEAAAGEGKVLRDPNAPIVPEKSGDRALGLDVLRGLAALIVLFQHFTSNYQLYYGHHGTLPFAVTCGERGVQLFFMISGFVIFMSLDRARSVADFAFARVARLMPTYWLCIILTTVVVRLLSMPDGTHGQSLGYVLWNIPLLWPLSLNHYVDGVYWSLFCEALFYIAMALLVAVGLRRYVLAIFSAVVVYNIVNVWPTHFRADMSQATFAGVGLLHVFDRATNAPFDFLFLLGMTI
jgi:peptidoglycan/LPS O-acetylase OafA/YrhL